MALVCALPNEGSLLQLYDSPTVTELLEQPPIGAPPADQGLQRLADFAHIAIHEQLAGAKFKVPTLTMQGHPLAVRQAGVLWEKIRANHAVDCLPVRTAHSPEGEEHIKLLGVMNRMQEKYPQVAVEMQPMMSKSGLVHQLWLSCADDELLLACRGEFVVCLSHLFPGEYEQLAVRDTELWVNDELDNLQSVAGVAVLLDRQRQALLVCGSAKQVEHASQFVEDFERCRLAVRVKESEESAALSPILGSSGTPDQSVTTSEAAPKESRTELEKPAHNNVDERCALVETGHRTARGQCSSPSMELRANPSVDNHPDANDSAEWETFHWYYFDDDENIQGPFDTEEMREWWEFDLLPEDLCVCCVSPAELPPTDKACFYPLDKLLSAVEDCNLAQRATNIDNGVLDEAITRDMNSEFNELGV